MAPSPQHQAATVLTSCSEFEWASQEILQCLSSCVTSYLTQQYPQGLCVPWHLSEFHPFSRLHTLCSIPLCVCWGVPHSSGVFFLLAGTQKCCRECGGAQNILWLSASFWGSRLNLNGSPTIFQAWWWHAGVSCHTPSQYLCFSIFGAAILLGMMSLLIVALVYSFWVIPVTGQPSHVRICRLSIFIGDVPVQILCLCF